MGLIKKLAVIFLLVFFVAVVWSSFSLDYTGNIVKDSFSTGYALSHTDEVVSYYNQRFERIPSFARNLLGNEKINLLVRMQDNSIKQLALETMQGKIVNYSSEPWPKPTFVVQTSESAINSISSSKDPARGFGEAVRTGEIDIEAKKLSGKLKLFTAKLILEGKSLF